MKDATEHDHMGNSQKSLLIVLSDALYSSDSNQYYSKERTPTHVADRIHKHIKETENA
jgi:hypothetical protein